MKQLTLFSLLIFFSCSKEESIISPIEVPNGNTFQFELDLSSEFPVAHDVGLNYFNDITVGVISNSSNAIKIITAQDARATSSSPDADNTASREFQSLQPGLRRSTDQQGK